MEIKLENLSKIFVDKQKNETRAVDDLSIKVESGKLLGLLGPSGCGKSTTLYMIAGLHEPTSGKIFFGEDDVTKLTPEKRGIGLVFQNYALYPHMTIRQNIMFPLENLKMKKDEIAERTEKIAKLVGISNLLDRKPSQLSGGQQQRVAIARALVKTPKVLLLDEPLSNLDARLRLQMREEIKRIQRQTNTTTVFVTHDQEEAMSICDEIVLMEYGVEQQRGVPQEIYDNPKNLFVAKFLGTPPINLFKAYLKDKKIYIGSEAVCDATNIKKSIKAWDEIKEKHPIVLEDNQDIEIKIAGSTQNTEILEQLLKDFSALAGGFKYSFDLRGSKDAFDKVQGRLHKKAPRKLDTMVVIPEKKDAEGKIIQKAHEERAQVVDKRFHLGISSRELNFNKERGAVRFMRSFISNASVPVVNPNFPLDEIDINTLRKIFSKKVKSWKQINEVFEDQPIYTYLQNKKSGVRELAFQKLDIIRREKGLLSYIPVLREKKFKTEEEMIEALKQDLYGIGFISYKNLKNSGLKELRLEGLNATDETIKTGLYKLSSKGVLIATSNPKYRVDKLTIAFLDYVKSIEGNTTIRNMTSLYPENSLVVGIRPEGYEISEKGVLSLGYQYYESIGRDLSLVCENDHALSKTFRVILQDVKDASKLKDNKAKFTIKKDKVYVFDEETGERVL